MSSAFCAVHASQTAKDAGHINLCAPGCSFIGANNQSVSPLALTSRNAAATLALTLALAASLQAPRRPTNQHTLLEAKRSSKPPSSKGPRRITSDGVKRSGLSLRTQLSLVRAVNNAQAPTKQVREKKRTGITKRNETKVMSPRSSTSAVCY